MDTRAQVGRPQMNTPSLKLAEFEVCTCVLDCLVRVTRDIRDVRVISVNWIQLSGYEACSGYWNC